MYNIHTHIAGSNKSILNIETINDVVPEFYFSIGLHPWYIEATNQTHFFNQIRKLCCYKNMLAVGECGIDRVCKVDINLQKKVFLKHIEIANKYNKPIIIHCVKAYSDFIEIIKTGINKTPWVFHGFNSNFDIAQKLIEKKCYLSFGSQLLKSSKLQDTFKKVPTEKIFLETDTYNVDIVELYCFAAKIKEISAIKLAKQIDNNFNELFLPKPSEL